MTSDPVRLLEAQDLSPEERELLEAGRVGPAVDYDTAAGSARFRASLVLLGAAGAASTATSGARAASSALAKIANKAILAVTLPALAVGVGVGAYRAMRSESAVSVQGRGASPSEQQSALQGTPPGGGGDSPSRAASPSQVASPSKPSRAGSPSRAVEDVRAPSEHATTERGSSPVGSTPRAGSGRPPAAAPSAEPTITRVILEESEEPTAAPSRPESPSSTAAAVSGAAVRVPSGAATAAPAKTAEASPIASSKVRPTPAASSMAARARPPEPSSDAIDEMRAIAHARNLIAQDPAAALQALEVIRREHPLGYFGEERRALTIFALARSGNQALAREHAMSFVRAYPNGPFTDKVRATVGISTP